MVAQRRTFCFYCAPTQDIRAKYETDWRCVRCAADMDVNDQYTAKNVAWALRSYHKWQESDQHPPERADIEIALAWVRATGRMTALEKEAVIVRLIEGSSGRPMAKRYAVTESAVSQAIRSATRKIAVWLNSPHKDRLC